MISLDLLRRDEPVALAAFAAESGCTLKAAAGRLRAHGWRRVEVRGSDRVYAPRRLGLPVVEPGKPAQHLRCLLWDTLAASIAPRAAADLIHAAAVPRALAHRLLAAWERTGLIVRSSTRWGDRYRLHPDTDPAIMPPTTSTQRTAHDRIWAAIRVLRRFDVPTLMTIADTSRRWTQTYVGRLQRAGYLRIDRPGVANAGVCATYLLVRDVGRTTPRLPERSSSTAADGGVG